MESEARRLCDMGREFLDRGEPEEALRCYERAIDVDPENPDAWCGRGKAAYDLGRLERADRDFRRALRFAQREMGPAPRGKSRRRWWYDVTTRPYLRALHGHGLCRFWLGAYEDAARVFRKLLKLAPTDPLDVRFLVGETYLRMGKIERAIRELERIEDDPDALYNLGLAKFYARDFAGSVNAFRRAFFANLHLPPLLCERPPRPEEEVGASEGPIEGPRSRGKVRDDVSHDVPREGDDDPEAGSGDTGSHPKGLDSEAAAHDYMDRCGDFWVGRPLLQAWLDGVRRAAPVVEDIRKHLKQVVGLQAKKMSHGERARLEGENAVLRGAGRLAGSDRDIASRVLADVMVIRDEPAAPEAHGSK
jgi:tetratricopeptide (TPR) repeat protein